MITRSQNDGVWTDSIGSEKLFQQQNESFLVEETITRQEYFWNRSARLNGNVNDFVRNFSGPKQTLKMSGKVNLSLRRY